MEAWYLGYAHSGSSGSQRRLCWQSSVQPCSIATGKSVPLTLGLVIYLGERALGLQRHLVGEYTVGVGAPSNRELVVA